METVVWNKFAQNPDLKTKLIATGDAVIVEGNTWGDKYWGIYNNQGLNKLGKILMKTRSKLQETSNQLLLVSVRESGQITADIKLQITRSNKSLLKGWLHTPVLSPSWELFSKHRAWKNNGLWPDKWPEFVAQFKNEMSKPLPQKYLDRIVLRMNQGKTIALACFCPDSQYCHRSLVKELVVKN